ncbi:MAG: rhomboid family intramembrane serine protease [Pseudomonadota bacterium]
MTRQPFFGPPRGPYQRQRPSLLGQGLGRNSLILGAIMLLVQILVSQMSYQQDVLFFRHYALNPNLVRAALAGEAPLAPALWPFITSLFLHGGWFHLLNNLLFLAIFGSLVERHLGGKLLLFLFFACGFAGAALQVLIVNDWGPPTELVVGASGGLFGLMGAAFTCGAPAMRRGSPQRQLLIALVAINALLGLVSASGVTGDLLMIGWQSHLGGFLAGLALGRWLARP